MKINFPENRNINTLMRQLGYHADRWQRKGTLSFSRSLTGGRYPRFHVYFDSERSEINLHLDQKASRYENAPDHGAEYEGKVVEEEAKRIKDFLN